MLYAYPISLLYERCREKSIKAHLKKLKVDLKHCNYFIICIRRVRTTKKLDRFIFCRNLCNQRFFNNIRHLHYQITIVKLLCSLTRFPLVSFIYILMKYDA